MISFSVAFGLVGAIFDSLEFYDIDLMSDTHWLIRVAVFGLLTWILVKFFQFIGWLLSFQWWVYVIIFAIIIVVLVALYYTKYKFKYSKNINTNQIEDKLILSSSETKQTSSVTIVKYNKYLYPRCNSKLVVRHGPYGGFIGCESYPKCNYTRSKF